MPKRIIQKESVTNEQKLNDLLAYTTDVDGCSVWNGAVNTDGYAHMLGNVKVHRYVYELKTGEDIRGLIVRHKCDRPLCINPEHLSIGSVSDNVRDMDERGRRFRKITPELIAKIDELIATKLLKKKEVALLVGLDARRVSDVVHNRYCRATGRLARLG